MSVSRRAMARRFKTVLCRRRVDAVSLQQPSPAAQQPSAQPLQSGLSWLYRHAPCRHQAGVRGAGIPAPAPSAPGLPAAPPELRHTADSHRRHRHRKCRQVTGRNISHITLKIRSVFHEYLLQKRIWPQQIDNLPSDILRDVVFFTYD